MGLDISFYAVKKDEVGYFRKVNFILNYFGVSDDDNNEDIILSRDEFAKFFEDLECELKRHDLYDNLNDETTEKMPKNPRLNNIEVPFGGSIKYDADYWYDVRRVYIWADKTLKEFDWDNYRLVLNCWW